MLKLFPLTKPSFSHLPKTAYKPSHVPTVPLQYLVEPRYIKQHFWLNRPPVLSPPHLPHPHAILWGTPQLTPNSTIHSLNVTDLCHWYNLQHPSQGSFIHAHFLFAFPQIQPIGMNKLWTNSPYTSAFPFPCLDGVIFLQVSQCLQP